MKGKALCIALLLAGIFIFSPAEAKVEINVYDFGVFNYHETQGKIFLRKLINYLQGTLIAAKKERYRINVGSFIARTPEGKTSHFDVYLIKGDCFAVSLCETEPIDFRSARAMRKGARWMAAYVDFYIAAMRDNQLIYEDMEAGK